MQYIFLHFILYSLNYILIKCININYTPNSINPVNCVEDGFVKIANCIIWFSIIIFSNLATVFVDSEVSFAMSSTTSILGFDGKNIS